MTNFVSIAVVNDPGAAQIMRGYLEANGVDASIPDEAALTAQPFLGFALVGYRILVPGEQAEKARLLLAEVENGAVALPSEPGDLVCPECGSSDLRPVKTMLLPLLLLFGLGVPAWWNTKRLRCASCNTQFHQLKEMDPTS